VLAGDGRHEHLDYAGVGTNLNANDCATVSPTVTTVYTDRDQRDWHDSGQRHGQRRHGEDPVLQKRSGDLARRGRPVVLTWTTENATSVVLVCSDVPPTNLQPNGSFTVRPITITTYTLTAYGNGGQTVSVTISVFVR
jgi:2-polyprenyl-6-methoxyphenol hydroxylase-like FAD-dependent oxidoreductase